MVSEQGQGENREVRSQNSLGWAAAPSTWRWHLSGPPSSHTMSDGWPQPARFRVGRPLIASQLRGRGGLCTGATRRGGPKAEEQGTSQEPLARGAIKCDSVRTLASSEQRLPAPWVAVQLNPHPLWKELQNPYYLAPTRKPQHREGRELPRPHSLSVLGQDLGSPCALCHHGGQSSASDSDAGRAWGGALAQRTDSERQLLPSPVPDNRILARQPFAKFGSKTVFC